MQICGRPQGILLTSLLGRGRVVGLKLGVDIEFELAMRGVEMAVANGARINRQIFLLLFKFTREITYNVQLMFSIGNYNPHYRIATGLYCSHIPAQSISGQSHVHLPQMKTVYAM